MIPLLINLIPGRTMLLAGVSALAVAAAGYALHVHDVGIRAADAAAAQKVAIDTLNADHARAIAALEQVAAATQARAASSTLIRTAASAAPTSNACAVSPAVRAGLDGLRSRATTGGAATSAGQSQNVRAGTGAAAGAVQ